MDGDGQVQFTAAFPDRIQLRIIDPQQFAGGIA